MKGSAFWGNRNIKVWRWSEGGRGVGVLARKGVGCRKGVGGEWEYQQGRVWEYGVRVGGEWEYQKGRVWECGVRVEKEWEYWQGRVWECGDGNAGVWVFITHSSPQRKQCSSVGVLGLAQFCLPGKRCWHETPTLALKLTPFPRTKSYKSSHELNTVQ